MKKLHSFLFSVIVFSLALLGISVSNAEDLTYVPTANPTITKWEFSPTTVKDGDVLASFLNGDPAITVGDFAGSAACLYERFKTGTADWKLAGSVLPGGSPLTLGSVTVGPTTAPFKNWKDVTIFESYIYQNLPAGFNCSTATEASLAATGITPLVRSFTYYPTGTTMPGTTTAAADTTKPTLSSGSTTPAITAGTTAVATYTASETSTWSISGGDNAALFDVNSTSGALSFKKAAKKGNYLVELTATDAAGNKSDPIKITVTVKAALANTGAETSFTTPLALIAAGVTLSIYAQSIRRRNLSAIKR